MPDPQTGQTLIYGMGELHIEILMDRMSREFGVRANLGKPQVAYKETVLKAAEGEGKYVRQMGGKGQYGHCRLSIEPLPRGAGFVFVHKLKSGSFRPSSSPPSRTARGNRSISAILAGFPMTDIKVTLTGGSSSETDSTPWPLRSPRRWPSRKRPESRSRSSSSRS